MRDRESTTINDIVRNIPTISATLENQQAEHQATMVEMEGKIADQSVTVLIDLGASLSYISPQVVEKCNLKTEKFQQSWLVQLATGTKRKVTHKLPQTAIKLNDFQTEVNLNILPLGSYDLLIGMDWLEKKKAMMNCWDKTLHYVDEEGKHFILKGKPKPISVRQISALQLKITARKGYQVYAVHVEETEQKTE